MVKKKDSETLEQYAERRLLIKRKIDDNGCWIWTGCNNYLYGILRVNRKNEFVHRISAWLYLDYDLFSNEQINHKCDVKLCFNPEHLYIGSRSQNTKDSIFRGSFVNNLKGWNKRKAK